jgi:hypothetical protein
MKVSDTARDFFEHYEKALNEFDVAALSQKYADSFIFAGVKGEQAVKRDDFLKAIPKRQEFFKTIGLTSTKIHSLEETRLDDSCIMVKVHWTMRFEKNSKQPITDNNSATYLLYQKGSALRIVFQLDHQDLMKKAQDLGLLP